MPLYDFSCADCGERFEARVAPDERPACPSCASSETARVYSAFSGPFTIRPRGGEARRADAARRVREEQRAERREQRRSSPGEG